MVRIQVRIQAWPMVMQQLNERDGKHCKHLGLISVLMIGLAMVD